MGLVLPLLLLTGACAATPTSDPPPDLVLTGGAVYTLDASRRWAEALAVRDGRIVRQCAEARQGRPWIVGGGWAMPSFPGGLPSKEALDAVTGATPTALNSADGHSTWINSAALAAASITNDTPDPAAGRIERDANGEATGVLLESATELVSRVLPPVTAAEYEAGLIRALARMNRFGIVSLQEANARDPLVAAYRAVAREGKLTARARLSLYTNPAEDQSQVDRLVRVRAETVEPGVTAGAAKIFIDGVIESGTAMLVDPCRRSIRWRRSRRR